MVATPAEGPDCGARASDRLGRLKGYSRCKQKLRSNNHIDIISDSCSVSSEVPTAM